MPAVIIDGVKREVDPGTLLSSVLPDHIPGRSIAVILPGARESQATRNLKLTTGAGEVIIEFTDKDGLFSNYPALIPSLGIKWTDRYTAAFGPFSSDFEPSRRPSRYERGDVIIGCGGYDPGQAYLVLSRMRHVADHGARDDGGVIGRVVSGRGVLDRFSHGDRVERIEPVISFSETSTSFTTRDTSIVLEEGMQVISRMTIRSQGCARERIDPDVAASVEHLLVALERGVFQIGRSTSTHIRDERFAGTDVVQEFSAGRRQGTVTVRTRGKSRGAVYIYTEDLTSSPAHTVVGQVTNGIELAMLAKEGETLSVTAEPRRFDLVGLPTPVAIESAEKRGIKLISDCTSVGGECVIIRQTPATTLEALSRGEVELETVPFADVIDIDLDDRNAPVTCDIFRRITGLAQHNVGRIPFFFSFDDVFLFKPRVPAGVRIDPENTPGAPVPAGVLGMTNDSRKGTGMVGVRGSENAEFGPTSEPFDGTNIIGRVVDMKRLKERKEGETVFIREVNR
jgi:putative methanogenesis marker protein 3